MLLKYVHLLFLVLLFFLLSSALIAQQTLLDKSNSTKNWRIVKSDGVEASVKIANIFNRKSIEFDINFVHGTGYGGIQKNISLDLSDNFEFSFYLKGILPANNLEFKLLDSAGNNVWWNIKRNFNFPKKWTKIIIKKRDITFAWGPAKNKNLSKIGKIEITISSAKGGKGKIFIDSLSFVKLPPPPTIIPKIKVYASTFFRDNFPSNVLDKISNTKWISVSNKNKLEFLVFDFGYNKEIGGLVIYWDSLNIPQNFRILASTNQTEWDTLTVINNNNRRISYIQLKNLTTKFLKILLLKTELTKQVGIQEIEFEDYHFYEDDNYFFKRVAEDYPKGYYPRYLYDEQTYWTVAGVNGDRKEALINEDGMVEVDKQSFSIEPFLKVDGKVFNWNDVRKNQKLKNNYLPIPSVQWKKDSIQLTITALTDGQPGNSYLYLHYNLLNEADIKHSITLYLTVRPFQVNPPWQSLNFEGGVSKISKITANENLISINNKKIIPLTKPSNIQYLDFNNLSLYNLLINSKFQFNNSNIESNGFSSLVISYNFVLQPKTAKQLTLLIPFYPDKFKQDLTTGLRNNFQFKSLLQKVSKYWDTKINHVKINLPKPATEYLNTLKSNLAYILINRDSSALQPGSRSYERSWIRDGSLTSAALLRFGIKKEVRDFIEWYKEYLFPSGKVPCVVDSRGADPVDENDSNGEFIYLIYQYFAFTRDTTFLRNNFSYVRRSVDYLQSLIKKGSLQKYKFGDDRLLRAFYGLVPESISHEGYSAHPEHSYWDDFFVLLGLKDAAKIASVIGYHSLASSYKNMANTFRTNFYSSIKLSAKLHNINFIPGSVELGDFDPTSTTVAIYPCNETNLLPQFLLHNTFSKYYNFFEERLANDNWINFTPYEVRTVGTFNIMGMKDKAFELLDFFMQYRRPKNWNEWAEVVWKDKRAPKFIGDMPHTWIGSDFINSFRTFFAYEDELNDALILCSGLKKEWVDDPKGIEIENLPTYYGEVNYSVKKTGTKKYRIQIWGKLDKPAGGIIIKNFLNKKPKSVIIKNKLYYNFNISGIKLNRIPCNIDVIY